MNQSLIPPALLRVYQDLSNRVRQRVFNQPPDLDEIWRDINEKISRLFGGGKKLEQKQTHQFGNNPQPEDSNNTPPSSRPPPFPMDAKATGKGIGVILAVIMLIWLATGFYVVQEGQQAVVMRFGKFKGSESGGVTGAGVNWRLPYPFEAHEVVQVSQLRSVEVGRNKAVQSTSSQGAGAVNASLRDSSMLTQDENIVDVRFVVQYRLKSSSDYIFNNRDPDEAVILAAESAVREVVGKGTMNTVLNEKREAIAGDIVKSIQSQLDIYKNRDFDF